MATALQRSPEKHDHLSWGALAHNADWRGGILQFGAASGPATLREFRPERAEQSLAATPPIPANLTAVARARVAGKSIFRPFAAQ